MSGPVLRPSEFFPQINTRVINAEDIISGFNRFLFGLFKKMVIADRLAPAVHSIFDKGDHYSSLTTIVGAWLFTIQLYFDFSAYTDMALGAGKMLGFELPENFKMPLRSSSVSEFWRRWHMSLISWFSNYIYYPLVYRLRDKKKAAVLVGIVVTFLVSGIWHGIGLTFLAWAVCHIIYLSYETLSKGMRQRWSERGGRLYKWMSVLLVFNLVSLSNLFFRASSWASAKTMLHDLLLGGMPQKYLRDLIAPLVKSSIFT
jgi:D-alanyl-lipoteichoic acid acyltransferase DltB (MBOAT superfamily)